MINKDEVTADLKAVETQAEGSAGKMGGAFSNLGGIISSLAGPAVIGAVTAAIVGMAKTGFENIKQVEDQMHAFQVATGASGEEAEKFGETIKAMHKVNTDSYEDIGAAVTAVRQRFGDLGEGMQDVTQGFMDYAKVTGQDTVSAMNSVSDVLARFNLPLDEAGVVMDKFKAASQATSIPIGELQAGLEKAGTQFTAMGFSIDESVAMLGAFHKAGVDASTMQRSLNTFMNNTREISDSQADSLSKLGVSLDIVYFASDKTAEKAKEFGIELSEGQRISEDMARELQGLGIEFDSSAKLAGTQKEALQEMFETLAKGETDVETMQAAMQMFGTRAGPEMVQALQSGTMSIEELMSVLENSEGTVSEASDVFDKQLGERWELIRRKYLEPFMEVIGVRLMDLLEYVLDKVDEWGPYIEAGFEFFRETVVPILNVFMDVAKNVFGVVGGLIETLIGVFTGDWDRALQGVKDMWDSVWNGVVALLDGLGLVDAISNMWDSAMAFMRELPQKMIDMGVNIIDGLVTGIKDAVGRPIEAVKEAAGNILGTVKGWFGIKSPSTVMAEVGVNLMEGMAEGIDAGSSLAVAAMAGAGQEILDTSNSFADRLNLARLDFENSWNKKLFNLTADRIGILEAERDEQIKIAKELGADTEAIRAYYETLITQEQDKQAKERVKRAEDEAKKHQSIWQKIGVTVESISKDIGNNVINMFDSNYKAGEDYRKKRAKIQDDIARQIEELDKKRLEELALVAGNAEEMEKVERKYAKEKDKLHKEQQKQLRDTEDAYKENRLTIKDVLKDMVLDIISALEKQIMAQEIAAVAAAWAMSITTLGASLAKLAAALPKIAIQIGALEALKAGIRGLATGGVVKGGADQVFRLGDGREDEAVLPLNASVFNRLAEGITQQMSTTNNRTITQNITIQSPTPLSPAEIARKNKQQLRNLALEWGM